MGQRQGINACVVYQLAKYLKIEDAAIARAFAGVRLPGRFEVLTQAGKTFVLDGAHNAQAVELFLEFLAKTPYAQDATLLCGFMKDKDYKKLLSLLCLHFKDIIVTVPSAKRGAQKEDILPVLPKGVKVRFFKDPSRAFSAACQAKKVVCTGSFYLVGLVRQKLLERGKK